MMHPARPAFPSANGFPGSSPVLLRALSAVILSCGFLGIAACNDEKKAENKTQVRPAMTVTTTNPRIESLAVRIQASGNVAAWQEASIGSEIVGSGLRLTEVLVNIGDVVKKGQLLAQFNDESVRNDLAQQHAATQEAEANLAQAKHNIERARALESSGSLSRQEIIAYETQAATAEARLESARALLAAQELRLRNTRIVSPDDGAISARSASVGTVAASGAELFRLIRKNRLEWRAEMRAVDLTRIKPGQPVDIVGTDGVTFRGSVRQVAPTIDTATRTGLAYVDLPERSKLKAGMFVTATVIQGNTPALVVPQVSIVVRDGSSYVFRITPDNHVYKVKIETGRRDGDWVEVLDGITKEDRITVVGTGFLHEGDLVRAVEAPPITGKSSEKAAGVAAK